MAEQCPHCGSRLAVVQDGFCGECRGALDEPPAPIDHRVPARWPQPVDVGRRHESIEVLVCSKGQILRNLAGYLPITLWSAFVAVVFGSAVLQPILRLFMEGNLAGFVGITAASVIVVLGGLFFIWFTVNQWSQSRLALLNDTVIVRGERSWGFREKHYAVGDIAVIAFGEPLNAVERITELLNQFGSVPLPGMIGLLEDIKAGRLVIVNKSGGRDVFHYYDKVFDPESLSVFAAELSRRGVVVAGPA